MCLVPVGVCEEGTARGVGGTVSATCTRDTGSVAAQRVDGIEEELVAGSAHLSLPARSTPPETLGKALPGQPPSEELASVNNSELS